MLNPHSIWVLVGILEFENGIYNIYRYYDIAV